MNLLMLSLDHEASILAADIYHQKARIIKRIQLSDEKRAVDPFPNFDVLAGSKASTDDLLDSTKGSIRGIREASGGGNQTLQKFIFDFGDIAVLPLRELGW